MHSNAKDIELIYRIKEGDRNAFNQLFLEFHMPLLRFAIFLTEEDEAKDLIADLFLDLWMKRSEISISTSVAAYLHIAIKNRALNHKRRKSRNIWVSEEELNYIPEETFNNPENILITKEFNEQINRCIGRLPERCRMIFLLNRDNRLSYQEIAVLLNISLNTVKTQMFRALSFLRKSLYPSTSEASRRPADEL